MAWSFIGPASSLIPLQSISHRAARVTTLDPQSFPMALTAPPYHIPSHWLCSSCNLLSPLFPKHSNSFSPQAFALGVPCGGNAKATSFSSFKSQPKFHFFRSPSLTILSKVGHLTPATLSVATVIQPHYPSLFLYGPYRSQKGIYSYLNLSIVSSCQHIKAIKRKDFVYWVCGFLSLEPSKARHSNIC